MLTILLHRALLITAPHTLRAYKNTPQKMISHLSGCTPLIASNYAFISAWQRTTLAERQSDYHQR